MAENFRWTPSGSLPPILDHTRRKLDVIAQYLDVYLDTLSQDVRMDQLNVSFVDGFCGGGAYRGDDGAVLGSPLVLLKAVEDAERRINEDRRKPFTINARYFFIDSQADHIARLRETLSEYGYSQQLNDRITILEGAFEDHLPAILQKIGATQRVGRSIFLLDQCGYKDVQPNSLRQIFSELQSAEIILTFAIDGLLNYLSDDSPNNEMLRSLGITRWFLDAWRERHSTGLTRPLAQRIIMNNLCEVAAFMTPFMLRSESDNRDMALIHLSGHQMARNKMLGVHWNAHNVFRHCGSGSLYTLGFDKRLIETGGALFNFEANDRAQMHNELMNDLPANIHEIIKDGGLPVKDLLDRIGNRTAARNSDIFEVLKELVVEEQFVIRSSGGNQRRLATLPRIEDTLEAPTQTSIFSMFRDATQNKVDKN